MNRVLDSFNGCTADGIKPKTLYEMVVAVSPVLKYMRSRKIDLKWAIEANFSDFFSSCGSVITLGQALKFQSFASRYGYEYRKTGTRLSIFHGQEMIAACSMLDEDYNRNVDMKVMLHASERLPYNDWQQLLSKWPYTNGDLLPYYDRYGVLISSAPAGLPQFAWQAVNLKSSKEGYSKRLNFEMGDRLVELFKVANGADYSSTLSVSTAVEMLSSERYNRLKYKDKGNYSKTFMSLTSDGSNTFNKFYLEGEGRLLHPGSGAVDRLSRYAFRGFDVVGIDPMADGPDDFMGTWSHFLDCGGVVEDTDVVVSDACVYFNIGTGRDKTEYENFDLMYKGSVYQGLDETNTNILANEIYQTTLNARRVILKIALQDPKCVPEPMRSGRFKVFSKVRLHNSEIVVERCEDGETLASIMARMAFVVYNANLLRQEMDVTRVYPNSNYKERLVDLRPTVLQVCRDIRVVTKMLPGGVYRSGSKPPLRLDVTPYLEKKVSEIGACSMSVNSLDLSGMSFHRAIEHLADLYPYKNVSELVSVAVSVSRLNGSCNPEQKIKTLSF